MYKKKNQILSGIDELANYIDGYDVYNATILEKLREPGIEKEDYEITVYQYRPDLIAQDYYGSPGYAGILMLQLGIGLSGFAKGTVLRLIPKEKLDEILRRI